MNVYQVTFRRFHQPHISNVFPDRESAERFIEHLAFDEQITDINAIDWWKLEMRLVEEVITSNPDDQIGLTEEQILEQLPNLGANRWVDLDTYLYQLNCRVEGGDKIDGYEDAEGVVRYRHPKYYEGPPTDLVIEMFDRVQDELMTLEEYEKWWDSYTEDTA